MQATRYLDSSGKSVELLKVAGDRYLLCTGSPRYISADEVDLLYHPAEDRRRRKAPRRDGRQGGRRRRDRISLAEDQFCARTHEMLQCAALNLAMLRSQLSDGWQWSRVV